MLDKVYEVAGLSREGSTIIVELVECLPESQTPEVEGENEEERIAAKLQPKPEPQTDTDRVTIEMMESLKRFAPGAYAAVQGIQKPLMMPLWKPVRRRRTVYLSVSEDDYRAMGSPPLMSKLRLRLTAAKT